MILEREAELRDLSVLLDDVALSHGRVVLVRGEAGIGKSALISRFVSEVGERAHVLIGSCDDLLTPQPLGAIWDIGRAEPTVEAALHDDRSREVMEALLDLMHRTLRPTVMVIEDTQWADEASMDVIKFVGRRIGETNGLLILTYRDGEVDVDHPLRQVVGELPPDRLVRIVLHRLSPSAVASMIQATAFDLDEVLALTDGNPLFVKEVLASGTDTVPASVKDSVLARASKVSRAARELLDLVSVIPGTAELSLVGAILDLDADLVGECRRQGLLDVTETQIGFLHELQRRAIESSLGSVKRREINHRVVAALGREANPARLLHHAIGAGDIELIVEYAPQAARAAMDAGSTREAVSHFRLFDPYLDRLDRVERADMLEEWTRGEYFLGNVEALDVLNRAVEARRAAGDETALAYTLTYGARVHRSFLQNAEALESVSEAVEILEHHEPGGELSWALSLNAFIVWLYYDDFPLAVELADRALAVAEAGTDKQATIWALYTRGSISHSIGEPGGLSLVMESLRLALRDGFAFEEVRVLLNLAGMCGDVRDVDRAIDFIRRAEGCFDRNELGLLESDARAMLSEYLLWKGKWAEAENMATESLGSAPVSAMLALRILVTIQVRRGSAEASAGVGRLWERASAAGQLTVMDPAAAVMAEHLWVSGDRDPEHVSVVRRVLEAGLGAGAPWPSGPLAFWMWKLGFLDALPPGTADFYGWIISGDQARAVGFWRERSIPYETALALMHGDAHDQSEAVRLLESLGATATASRLRRVLLDSGLKLPRGRAAATRSNVVGLTARQVEVLELLVEGMTNTQIADLLFVSRRTVENHVAGILMKFDVSTREAAAEAAKAAGFQKFPT
jgi:DNA-binding CsgD family transcriptional regulator/tetratricopeptide (TPR) repeat protein